MSRLNFEFLMNRMPAPMVGLHREVLNFSDAKLGVSHGYIQWMFPTSTRSAFNPEAPLLNIFSVKAIRQHPDAVANFYLGLERMSDYFANTLNWTVEGDHNQLRITRILQSTTTLLGHDEAHQFFASFATKYARSINPHWSQWV
jgi:hypothetical protein